MSGNPGGAGGEGLRFSSGTTYDPQEHGLPTANTAQTAIGGSQWMPGSAGAKGSPGALGANGTGKFTSAGFIAGDGVAGKAGAPGQGGGGGGGSNQWCGGSGAPSCPQVYPSSPDGYWEAATGAGGGPGGCAGLSGTAGTGGGASIGLFVVESDITIAHSRIEGGEGGRAGKGTLGAPGLPGNNGGAGVPYGGYGGRGGDGGPAGLSGHGAPGPSMGLVWTGKKPTLGDGVEMKGGKAGDGAPALSRGIQGLPPVEGRSIGEQEF